MVILITGMDQANALFLQLGSVLGVAAVLGYLVWLLKLPLIVAYLLAGVLFSVLGLFDLAHSETFVVFSEIGIAFVLFFIGMEMDFREIRSLGRAIIVASLAQITISTLLGFAVATSLGFGSLESWFLGIGLAFSSTIVVIKMLLEKKDLNSLYGRLSIGILLLEDLVAIVILMVMTVGESTFGLGLTSTLPIVALFAKGGLLFFLTFVLSRFVLKHIFRAVAGSPELLFLTSLTWCFAFVGISLLLGFSVVIGAFLAGLALANSPFYYEIQGKVKPLRDFFVALFFVYLGSQVLFANILLSLPIAIVFVVYALIIKPLIFLFVLGLFGFRKHTIFQTAINLSQISEFSLIIAVVGFRMGVLGQVALTGIAIAGITSIVVSAIFIAYGRKIYLFALPFITLFERRWRRRETVSISDEIENHVVLIGAHRMGGEIIRFLMREKVSFIVLDFNPRVVQNLINEKIHAIYGDVGDPEVLEYLRLEHARVIISTAPDREDNLVLLDSYKRKKVKVPILLRAGSVRDAKVLYEAGADYVIVPEVLSGESVAEALRNHWNSLSFFKGRADLELGRLFRNKLVLG